MSWQDRLDVPTIPFPVDDSHLYRAPSEKVEFAAWVVAVSLVVLTVIALGCLLGPTL